MTTKSIRVDSGIFIPDSLLKEAGIERDDVEIEIMDNQIRIVSTRMQKNPNLGVINPESSFWKLVGSVKTPGVNGRDHDQYLYGTLNTHNSR